MPDYHALDATSTVHELIEQSHHHPVAILKHSTTCPISSLGKARVDRALSTDALDMPVYLLDLLRHREVSNLVSELTGVRHESPQLIVLHRGKAVYDSSHLNIDPAALPSFN